jgi:hypothetical protein
MALSKKKQSEILRLTLQGGEELTAAIEAGEAAYRKHARAIDAETKAFLAASTDRQELDFFAKNWNNWDGDVKHFLTLVANPCVDAGTLLQIYWYCCPEDNYLFCKSAAELDPGPERDTFKVLIAIERRFKNGDIQSALIPFDPASHVSMRERHSEFVRTIPDVMFTPITGKKTGRG